MLPAILAHIPAGASVRQLAHYAQGIDGKDRRYDQGSKLANYRTYGSFNPPKYNLARVTAPVFLHYSQNDPLAEVPDVERLFNELGRPVGKFLVPLPKFNHIDFLWGIDVKE